ncbi:hypothetical protein J6590_078532 [Homalodisca vitripennis]|nr:hypothetical protein J6590_078532 [Homalodisca vitripennis]
MEEREGHRFGGRLCERVFALGDRKSCAGHGGKSNDAPFGETTCANWMRSKNHGFGRAKGAKNQSAEVVYFDITVAL